MYACMYAPGLDPQFELCTCSVCTTLRREVHPASDPTFSEVMPYEQCICHECAGNQICQAYPELKQKMQDPLYRRWRSEQDENKQLSYRCSGSIAAQDFSIHPDMLRLVFSFVGSNEADTIVPVCKQWRSVYYATFRGQENVRNAIFAQSLRKYKHIHTRSYFCEARDGNLPISDKQILCESQYLWWYSLDEFPERHPEAHDFYYFFLDHPDPTFQFLSQLQRHPVFQPPEKLRQLTVSTEDIDGFITDVRRELRPFLFRCDHVPHPRYR